MPNYYNPYAFQYQTPVIQQQQQIPQQIPQQMPQIQNGGFVSVRNETEARNYPVALGNSVTFKDETAPYIYTKTMGFSQLDAPKFDKYKLVKESSEDQPKLMQDEVFDNQAMFDTVSGLKGEIKAIWGEIEELKNDRNKSDAPAKRNSKRKEDGDNKHDE